MTPFDTYADFQAAPESEKVVLVVIEARKRLLGWVLDAGSVYKITGFSADRVVSIVDSGTAYTAGASASLSAGEYYHDRANSVLYLRASDSSHPNSRYLVLTENLYFSTNGMSAPYDHGVWSGYDVYYRDGLEKTSDFGVELDSENQLGEALEGSGTFSFKNDQDFWQPIFEKKNFNNANAYAYSYNPGLPITEAKLLYRGKIQGKTYSESRISFKLADRLIELRAPVALARISAVPSVSVPPQLSDAFQRRVYGEPKGVIPTAVDQILDTGKPLAGTVGFNVGVATLVGTGTDFLAKLSPGDQLVIADFGDEVTIQSVESDVSATLSEAPTTTVLGKTYAVKPELPKRYANRSWVIAGHALREPATTVTAATGVSQITVGDATDIEADSEILVGSEKVVVRRVTGNKIRLDTNLEVEPSIGAVVKRLAVTNVRINDRLLEFTRDYTVDAAAGTLALDPLAEFNITPIKILTGTVTFTSASRTVTGTGTAFTSQLTPNSWIRAQAQSTWYEVLQIISDTELRLRVVSAYSATSAALFKDVKVFNMSEDVLSCDPLGATENGVKTGTWVKTAPQVVKHLLTEAGLGSDIQTDTFTTAKDIAYARVGFVLPEKFKDTRAPTYRDVIGMVNKAVFGSLIQTPDFKYEYHVLRPRRVSSTALRLDEADALGWSINAQLDKIVKTARIEYLRKEHDWQSGDQSSSYNQDTNDAANYLAKATKEWEQYAPLVREADAITLAQRFAFLFASAYTTISVETKMQVARSKIADVVDFTHAKLYEREGDGGSGAGRKIGALKGSRRNGSGGSIEIEDLANAFTQCGTIAPTGTLSWTNSGENDRLYNGYITDQYGMQANDADTYGVSRIW